MAANYSEQNDQRDTSEHLHGETEKDKRKPNRMKIKGGTYISCCFSRWHAQVRKMFTILIKTYHSWFWSDRTASEQRSEKNCACRTDKADGRNALEGNSSSAQESVGRRSLPLVWRGQWKPRSPRNVKTIQNRRLQRTRQRHDQLL